MKVARLIDELKRRKVARRGLLYLVVAWILMQVVDIVFPALSIPDWALSMVVVLLILGFPVAIVLAWMFETPVAIAKGKRRPDRPARAGRADGEEAADAPRSIAVLPFVNMSDDKDNEYFSDGMTEEILNALTKVPGLRVASRTSSFAFKGQAKDVLEIAEDLRVDSVVEGSVRKAGERVRVTAQLISADDGYHLWSETYDGDLEDIFRLQDEIARSIVEALKIELVGSKDALLVEAETEDVEAYTHYLQGRFFFNRFQENDLERSLEQYRQALEHDPKYGRAYAGIADTWMQLADDWVAPDQSYPEAKAAAQKAIDLDESLAEAHTALGKVHGWFEWDFDRAELALRRAVATNPKYPDAHWGLGSILPPNGQLGAAIEEMRAALA
ncbi:MAG: tetratricopeptide repeat protein, partial [Longimicrobiales bacterium]